MNSLRCLGAITACAVLLIASQSLAARDKKPAPSNAAADTPGKVLPHQGDRVAVAIYDFRSSVTELPARGSTDMFIDALVHTGRFKVVERSQLNQSLLVEKQLGSQGLSDAANDKKLRAAQYLFEGTISEANPSEAQHSGAIGVAGMSIGGGKNKDVIAIDVRVLDAQTGDILDSITVRKPIKSTSSSVSGIGNLLSTVMAEHGKSSPYTPDVNATSGHKESLDQTLRAAIDEAVAQLSTKF